MIVTDMRTMRYISLLLTTLIAGCLGTSDESGIAGTCQDSHGARAAYTNCRAFRGRLLLPHPSKLRAEAKPLQIAAVGFERADAKGTADAAPATGDGGPAPTTVKPTDKAQLVLFTGDVFAAEAGAGQTTSIPFSIVVPCQVSVNLLLTVARGGGHGAGLQVAPLAFARDSSGASTALGTLIPRQPANSCGSNPSALDLGQVTLVLPKDQSLAGASITLGQGKSKNPLALLDTDRDQATDLADSDDDGDGINDLSDDDAEGDGIKDSAQSLTALPDKNKDGVADMFQ